MNRSEGSPALRIGELSRRLGVSDHALRAWESRYGLLQPARSAGGFRLYSEADELRVRRMQAHLARGLSAAEAARAVLGEDDPARAEASGAVEPHRAPATAISSSSGSAGSAERPASPRSTSQATSSAGGSPGWLRAGEAGTALTPSWPAPPGSYTTWR
jgi:DNA-binding transcriptional MerR regulator